MSCCICVVSTVPPGVANRAHDALTGAAAESWERERRGQGKRPPHRMSELASCASDLTWSVVCRRSPTWAAVCPTRAQRVSSSAKVSWTRSDMEAISSRDACAGFTQEKAKRM